MDTMEGKETDEAIDIQLWTLKKNTRSPVSKLL